MPEMRQCAADSYREIRPESRTAILGLLGVSQVPDDAELIDIRDSKESWSVPKYPLKAEKEFLLIRGLIMDETSKRSIEEIDTDD